MEETTKIVQLVDDHIYIYIYVRLTTEHALMLRAVFSTAQVIQMIMVCMVLHSHIKIENAVPSNLVYKNVDIS